MSEVTDKYIGSVIKFFLQQNFADNDRVRRIVSEALAALKTAHEKITELEEIARQHYDSLGIDLTIDADPEVEISDVVNHLAIDPVVTDLTKDSDPEVEISDVVNQLTMDPVVTDLTKDTDSEAEVSDVAADSTKDSDPEVPVGSGGDSIGTQKERPESPRTVEEDGRDQRTTTICVRSKEAIEKLLSTEPDREKGQDESTVKWHKPESEGLDLHQRPDSPRKSLPEFRGNDFPDSTRNVKSAERPSRWRQDHGRMQMRGFGRECNPWQHRGSWRPFGPQPVFRGPPPVLSGPPLPYGRPPLPWHQPNNQMPDASVRYQPQFGFDRPRVNQMSVRNWGPHQRPTSQEGPNNYGRTRDSNRNCNSSMSMVHSPLSHVRFGQTTEPNPNLSRPERPPNHQRRDYDKPSGDTAGPRHGQTEDQRMNHSSHIRFDQTTESSPNLSCSPEKPSNQQAHCIGDSKPELPNKRKQQEQESRPGSSDKKPRPDPSSKSPGDSKRSQKFKQKNQESKPGSSAKKQNKKENKKPRPDQSSKSPGNSKRSQRLQKFKQKNQESEPGSSGKKENKKPRPDPISKSPGNSKRSQKRLQKFKQKKQRPH